MLSKMGADGRIALTRRLGAIADRRGGDVSSAAASREATRIIELLGAKVPTEPDLIPALVPLLRGKHKIWAALALDKIDWSGRNGIAHLETRLAALPFLGAESGEIAVLSGGEFSLFWRR
jgi:hypothetical protein